MRYDILYSVHIPGIGQVRLYFDDIVPRGFYIYASGLDDDNNRIDLVMDRLVYPNSRPDGCGYCHIISYTMNGETTTCDHYRPIK